MKGYTLIKIDNDELVEMLVNRLDYWDASKEVKELYEKMYTNYAENGCFEEAELNVNGIVDNDYINYCHVLDDSDDCFEAVLKHYHDGDYDISCEDDCDGYSFIEAVLDDESMILVRR